MNADVGILAFSGSTRTASYNKQLVRIAADAAAKAGARVTLIDLRDYPLPVYDQDLEEREGLPPSARDLKELLMNHKGLLLACPEYNSSITPVLKNTLDWTSRAAAGEKPLACYQGKVAAVMSASPGSLGGLRGLVHMKAILGNIGVLVLPGQVAIAKAHEAFTDDGSLRDAKQQEAVRKLGRDLYDLAYRLSVLSPRPPGEGER